MMCKFRCCSIPTNQHFPEIFQNFRQILIESYDLLFQFLYGTSECNFFFYLEERIDVHKGWPD